MHVWKSLITNLLNRKTRINKTGKLSRENKHYLYIENHYLFIFVIIIINIINIINFNIIIRGNRRCTHV